MPTTHAYHGARDSGGQAGLTAVARPLVVAGSWAVVAVAMSLTLSAFWLMWLNRSTNAMSHFGSTTAQGIAMVAYLTVAAVGATIVSKRPRHPIGWLLALCGIALLWVCFAEEYAIYAIKTAAGSLPFGATVAWTGGWGWEAAAGVGLTSVLLLFPTGRLPSRRWRPAAVFAAGGIAAMVAANALAPGPLDLEFSFVDNPFGVAWAPLRSIRDWAWAFLAANLVIGTASLVVRSRSAQRHEAQQIKLLLCAGALAAVTVPLFELTYVDGSGSPWLVQGATAVALMALPVAFGLALLRYHLFDIDLVLSKTLLYGGLAAFITGVYVVVVVGVGTLLGARNEADVLSILAAAVVAVAFQPVRQRLTTLANRLVYGVHATPYQVLSAFSRQLGETLPTDEILSRTARLLAEGTGAQRAQVWLKLDDRMHAAASWPHLAVPELAAVVNPDGSLPDFAEVDAAAAVAHQGELLGALTVTKPRGEPVSASEAKLLNDLAAQAALMLRNVSLTEELKLNLRQLRESRQRLVAAQDAERRRLERDLHDGAQQQLIALKIRLAMAKTLAQREGAPGTAGLVEQVAADADDCVETLRALAHGIYPPLLAAEGLVAALTAQARKAAVPVVVQADALGRYPQDVEAAVYFCVLEALQNAAKYAQASQVTVRLLHDDGHLTFEVADDGVGFDTARTPRGGGSTNMADRVDALGGELRLDSAIGQGTIVRGTIPAAPRVETVGTSSPGPPPTLRGDGR